MSAGHGALHLNLEHDVAWSALALLFALKAAASALTIGFGFRGGLFFASLMLGGLLGKLFSIAMALVVPDMMSAAALAVVGMTAFGVAVVGGPLTMTFLALEVTGELPIAVLVLAAAMTSSLVVRQTFGYSFSTWRFHLRGETIRSAHDIGWMRDLTVGRLMRRDLVTVSDVMSPSEFRSAVPLGATQQVAITDATGKYVAMVRVAKVHGDALSADPKAHLSDFFEHCDRVLVPEMNAKEAVNRFDAWHAEALAVVDNVYQQRVLGLLSETHVLRRYSEELDKQRRTYLGST